MSKQRSSNAASPAPPSAPSSVASTSDGPASLHTGTVEGAVDIYLSVRQGQRRVLARRATSCLVEPIAGDRVLLAEEAEQAFVLAVLEREGDVPTTIATDGDLELSPRGKFVVTAPAGVHLATARDMTLTATTLEAVADEGSLVWKVARFASRTLTAEIAKVELTSEEATSIVGRLVQRAKRVFRTYHVAS